MLSRVFGAAVNGLTALPVTIEVYAGRGMRFFLVGLPDNAVRESHERIVAALENSGFGFPARQITVNMSPADVRKEGTAYDLPIAIGIMAADGKIRTEGLDRTMMIGELGLDGSIRPVKGALPIAVKARELGFDKLIVPADNAREAAVVNRLKVYGADNIRNVADFLNGMDTLQQTIVNTREEFFAQQYVFEDDMADVKGQQYAKRALEVAAAGGHNLIMVGPPGSGKSMLAKRLPSILPPLTLGESLETTQIHSVAGQLKSDISLISKRPFRTPHHTISQVALAGGGNSPQPGEISLAHNGVLFCDELPEFSRTALETMRQPLEDRVINISRAKYSVTYPCSFMFVASMNPCPCGYYGHPDKKCVCTPGQIMRYMNRISGPLMDRIDLQVSVFPVSFEDMTAHGDDNNSKESIKDKAKDTSADTNAKPNTNTGAETSAEIRERVIKARKIQEERFAGHPGIHCNAQMNRKLLNMYAKLGKEERDLLKTAMYKLQLSARAYDKILKVARTIADLQGSKDIKQEHIAEAIGFRNMDRRQLYT